MMDVNVLIAGTILTTLAIHFALLATCTQKKKSKSSESDDSQSAAAAPEQIAIDVEVTGVEASNQEEVGTLRAESAADLGDDTDLCTETLVRNMEHAAKMEKRYGMKKASVIKSKIDNPGGNKVNDKDNCAGLKNKQPQPPLSEAKSVDKKQPLPSENKAILAKVDAPAAPIIVVPAPKKEKIQMSSNMSEESAEKE